MGAVEIYTPIFAYPPNVLEFSESSFVFCLFLTFKQTYRLTFSRVLAFTLLG